MSIFVTADQHFNHSQIIDLAGRPYTYIVAQLDAYEEL